MKAVEDLKCDSSTSLDGDYTSLDVLFLANIFLLYLDLLLD